MNVLDYILDLSGAALLGVALPFRLRRPGSQDWAVMRAAGLLALSGALMLRIVDGEMARAFGLLGAASIVRYRYGLASSRDASALILSLAVGMAVGVHLWALALGGTALVLVLNAVFDTAGPLAGNESAWVVEVRGKSPEIIGITSKYLSERGLKPVTTEVELKDAKERGALHRGNFAVNAPSGLDVAAIVTDLSALGVPEVEVKKAVES